MKKLLIVILLQILITSLLFGAAIDSRKGYGNLSWGTSVEDAKRSGYKLTPMVTAANKIYLNKLYTDTVDAYKVTVNDKNISVLEFHYYQGKLFSVTEVLTDKEINQKKLESRYGKFNERGIFQLGKQFLDAEFNSDDGKVVFLSIVISQQTGYVSAVLNNWDVYKRISLMGRALSGIGKVKTITEEFNELAKKIVQVKHNGSKPTIAFLPLTTDYKNTLVENYITDALTEAAFNTNTMKIIERSNLQAILTEQKFQASGLVNEATAKSIGMLAGADYVCFGTLKDLGNQFKVNIRVVDVETGEICSIASGNVSKDSYLKAQNQETVVVETKKNVISETTKSKPVAVKNTPVVSNTAWKVRQYRDQFSDFTQYIFTLYSTDEKLIFVSYKKCDNSANDRVIAGVDWGYRPRHSWDTSNSGIYDIKGSSGTTVTRKLNNVDNMYLSTSQKNFFPYAWDKNSGSRWLVDIIRKNNSVAIRRDGLTRKFKTSGFIEVLAQYDISWADVDNALSNEEF